MARPPGALLLAPGAGADRNQAQLVAIDDAVSALGWEVARMDFPYRIAGRRAPDRQSVLLQAVREARNQLVETTGLPIERIVLGGRSMGGRICSMVAASDVGAAGLVLVSYPLHPPGRPDKQAQRTAHFPAILLPCLFVSGTRDAFGTRAELEAATDAIAGKVTHLWLEGGAHGLRGRDAAVGQLVADWIASLSP